MTTVSHARDASWTRAQTWKNDAIHALIRLAIAIAKPMPAWLLRGAGRALAAFAFVVIGHARRTALANLARAIPELSPRARLGLARRAYVNLGAHLGDAVAMLDARTPLDPLPMSDADLDVLLSAAREGRGVIFASAHLGPWERVAATLIARGVPLVTLARESYDARLDALYEKLRAPRGVRAIYRGKDGAAARIVRALRAGDVLGAPMDLRSRVPSVDALFLGAPAPTPVGPARLALRTGAAVVIGTVAPSPLPHGGGLCITCTRIEALPDMSDLELTTRINAELSRRVLALPEQWVWMHPRFEAGRPDASRRE